MSPVRRSAARLVPVLALSLALAAAASAEYREFTGKVDAIDGRKLVVDNRMGDKLTFERLDATRVSGQEKRGWSDLAPDDWVTVHWKLTDKPRKAHRVDVLPPKP
jgi:hypothetical protein